MKPICNSLNLKLTSKNLFWLLACFALAWIIISKPYGQKQPGFKVIEWDVTLYYTYLPALFIYDDIKLQKEWKVDLREHQLYRTKKAPNGNPYLKMTSGMAILYSPYFFIAHGATSLFNPEIADGYSTPYRVALILGSFINIFIGIWFLRKVLLRFYSDKVTAAVLAIVFLGTNLLHYTVWRGAMSHGHSFMLSAIFLYYLFKYKDNPTLKSAVVMGITSGLIVLIRPVNALIPLAFMAYLSNYIIVNRRVIIWTHWFLMALCAFLILFIQMLYWKVVTDHWIFYSYADEGFFWSDSKIIEGLFSYRKGWFIYSPLMILALVGIGALWKKKKALSLSIGLMAATAIFVTYAWWCWWYGGSFGSRPMIDFYAVLSIPLGAFLTYIDGSKSFSGKPAVFIITLLISISVFQNWQYQKQVIHHDSMTQKAYWTVFLKPYSPANYQELLDKPDYEEAKKGRRDL